MLLATPKLMESCWVTESKPFPVLASSVERSPRVMLFMAVNWVDMAMPSMNRGRMSIHRGRVGVWRANWAIMRPMQTVTPVRVTR